MSGNVKTKQVKDQYPSFMPINKPNNGNIIKPIPKKNFESKNNTVQQPPKQMNNMTNQVPVIKQQVQQQQLAQQQQVPIQLAQQHHTLTPEMQQQYYQYQQQYYQMQQQQMQLQQQQQAQLQQQQLQQAYKLELAKLVNSYKLTPLELCEKNIHNAKLKIFSNIEQIAYANNCGIFGQFIANKIYISDVFTKFTAYIQKHEKAKGMPFPNNVKEMLYYCTSRYFKPYQNRLDIPSHIDIMIHNESYRAFCTTLKNYTDQNKIGMEVNAYDDLTKLPNFKLINTPSGLVYLVGIVLSFQPLNINITIYLYVYNQPASTCLQIPYGLYESENMHIVSFKYGVFELQNSGSKLDDVLTNIRHNRATVMGFVDITRINEIKKFTVKRFDFMIGENNKSFFWLKNVNPAKPKKCVMCNLDITNQYLKLKCCNSVYHADCLIQDIICNVDSKCGKCDVVHQDPYKKSLDILMGLVGFYQ